MARRLNKKLLLGLGSTLGFLTTGVVSGFGIKAIVNQETDNLEFNQSNRLIEQSFTNAPDYNVAQQNMFINTTNLKSFHFGNTQIGQTVTPLGWLGVFEDTPTKKNRIALTSWSGEILWVNEDYGNQTTDIYNVYDMKYDFNTNLIFVIRTNSPNGMFNPNGTIAPLQLDVLDGTTGKRVYDQLNSNYFVTSIQNLAKKRIEEIFLNNNTANEWLQNQARFDKLFYLDIASKAGTNEVLVSYIPKFTQLVQRKILLGNVDFGNLEPAPGSSFINNNRGNKLVATNEFIDSWRKMVLSIRLDRNKIDQNQTAHYTKKFSLRNSRQFGAGGSTRNWNIGSRTVSLSDYFLLANPFITISDRGNYLIHFIAANETGTEVLHKTVAFDKNGSSDGSGSNIREADQTQIMNNTGLFTLSPKAQFQRSWGFADRWNDLFVNANLIPNRNMFNNNSIVLAYPYASNENVAPNSAKGLPAFNVEQLLIDNRESAGGMIMGANPNNRDPKQSWNYTFGEDIVKHYDSTSGSFFPTGNANDVYPWPVGNNINITNANVDRLYNRLLTVSPFDNTIVYAAKPNVLHQNLSMTDANRDRSVGLWIGNRNQLNLGLATNVGRRVARPFVITNWNEGDVAKTIDSTMTNVEGLYHSGVTFDLLSTYVDGASKTHLNLYYNQTGSGRNDSYSNSPLLSSKIGLLEDVLQNDNNIWTENIARSSTISGNESQKLKLIRSTIDRNSFSTLIHSRANLDTWFARTWLNSTSPANLYTDNFRLNADENSSSRAVATAFNQKLNAAEFNNQTSVDLVSHWRDKNSTNNPPNYNRLIIKRPKIIVKGSVANKLPIETTYPLINNGTDFFTKPGWGIDRDNENRIIYKTRQEITNASYQILSSWKNQVRIDSIGNIVNNAITTANLNIRETHTFSGGNPQWYDARQNGAQTNPFGKVNNEVAINNFNPLRVVLKIAKPQGNLPAWFRAIDENRFFNTKYPLAKDALPGETTFQEIIQSFLAEKAQKIDLAQNSDNAAVGFGNLRIDGYLDLNPKVINNANINSSTIFTDRNKRILSLTNGQRIIYDDLYTDPYHEIYDQSAINYTDFNKYGFGSNVRANVQTSWTGQIPGPNTKINTSVNYSLLADRLVRVSPGDTANVFNFNYVQNNTGQLELSPTNVDWFKNHFFNFNRLINLFVQFEYQLSGQSAWNRLGTFYTDDQLRTAFNTTTNKLVLANGVVPGIAKLRFKLTSKGNSAASDPDHFVQLDGFVGTEGKYISKEHEIAVQKVVVNNQWFTTTRLNPNNVLLQDLTTQHLQAYEDQIFQQSPSITANATLRNKVKLEYQWTGETTWKDATAIIQTIQSKLTNWNGTDQGVWSLWNGTDWNNNPNSNSGYKIKVRFAKVNPNEGIDFVNTSNQPQSGNNLIGDLRTDVKTRVELGRWFDFLKQQKISARKGNANGTLEPNSFNFPTMTGAPGSAQFAGRPFAFMQDLLYKAGIRMRFKRWEANQGTWSNWLDSINDLNTYNPSNPQIIIGFRIDNPNVAVKDNNVDFTNDSEVVLNLNLPKVVQVPANVQQMINQFNQQNPFGGNTFELQVIDANLIGAQEQVVNALKAASQSGANNNFATLDNALEFKYQLGNSTFSDVNTLKTFLAGQTTDQTSNALKMQLSIKAASAAEYELATNFPTEFVLQNDNNSVIKKWIHGTAYEAALKTANAITLKAGSNKNNLQYVYTPVLQPLFNNPGQPGLIVQWSLGSNPTQWNDLKDGQNPLPNKVNPAETTIKIRVAQDPSSQVYLYGPQNENKRAEFSLDLSRIPTVIEIDNNWFKQLTLSVGANQFLQDISAQNFLNFENQFFALSDSLNNNDPLRAKVKLEYRFNNRGNTWMSADQIAADIQSKLTNFNTTDQGIWALSHDGTTFNGNNGITKGVYVIGARVTTVQANDPTIQFVNPANPDQPISGDQLAGNLKSNIKTKVDLSLWFNEILTKGISATRGAQPGQLNPATINIPGKDRPNAGSVQLGGKSFTEIERIFNNVNLFFQFKKYDPATSQWSGWLDRNQINSYDPRNPEIVIGLKATNASSANNQDKINLNVQPLHNGQPFGADSQLKVKLNVPKLVQAPNNPSETIKLFNDQNAFGGNTFKLDVITNKLTLAEQEFIKAIKAASQTAGNFDNLDTALFFTYKLGNSPDWQSANDLKTYLAGQNNVDQTSNELKIKVNLQQPGPGASPEFELDPNDSWEYNLLDNNNTTIKKWIHGTTYEAALAKPNAISLKAGSNKNNLQYNYDNDLLPLFENNGRDGLVVQWRLGSQTNWTNLKGTTNPLPKIVSANENSIVVRIAKDPNNNIYLYGPETESKQKQFTLDLSTIPVQIEIDNNWFNQQFLSIEQNKFLQDITVKSFSDYEKAFFDKSASLIGPNNAALRAKVKLEYQFNKNGAWMSGADMVQNIKQKLNNFNSTDQGVWVLSHDGTTYKKPGFDKNVYVINARVTTVTPNDPTIEFINPTTPDRPISGDQLAGNLKSNIQTKVDLSAWLNEIVNAGINATRGQRPGELDGTSIRIPGKQATPNNQPQVQFGGKDFNAIQEILNKVNVFVQYKKYDANANDLWSGWLDNQAAVNTYDVTNPQLVLGFKSPQTGGAADDRLPLNIKIFNGADEFTNNTTLFAKLNVPKLIKSPTNINETINKFNQQKAFGGNTFRLEVNSAQLKIAEGQFINDIKAASENNSRFDNLENVLLFKYKLGNTNWSGADELKAFLEKQSDDQGSNELKIKVELKPPAAGTNPEFELDTNFPPEFTLHSDNNTVIKKWIHGTTYEAALGQNSAITLQPGSNKNNLRYNYDATLQPLFQNNGRDGLVVQWRLGSNANGWQDLKGQNNPLPNQVSATENQIYVRIAKEQNNDIYLYGPEVLGNRQEFILDLSRIPTPIQINNAWFSELTLSVGANEFLQNISAQHFINFENAFFNKSASLNGPANATLRAKVKLEFQFNKRNPWMNAAEIAADIQQKLTNFNATDQGVWALSHDGITFNGTNYPKSVFVINARVTTVQNNDPTIQFVSANNPDQVLTDDQLAGNLKSDIKTKVDLNAWFNEITNKGINATRGNNPGQLNGATINIPGKDRPAGAAVQFGGKTFAQIEQILNKVNLFFQYKKYDSATGKWSGWLDSKNQVDMYDPKNPEIILGLRAGNPNASNANDRIALNVQATYNGQNFTNNTEFKVKLNVPKLVQNPADIGATIAKFNQQNAFGGNTYQLSVDDTKLRVAENQFINDIKTSSATGGTYDNLDNVLKFKYKLGNSDWKTATELKDYLLTQNGVDQTSNELKTMIELVQPANQPPEFELDPRENWEFTLLSENNPTIKKYLHGRTIEADLQANKISATGSKNNLQYTFNDSLNVFANNGQDTTRELILQYQLLNAQDQPVGPNQWTSGNLPNSVDPNVQKIKVRIAHNPNIATAQAIYVYGPEITNKQQVATVDLSQITTLIRINKAWLEANPIVTNLTDSQVITANQILAWEEKVWANVAEAAIPEIRQKVIIKYQFARHEGLTATNLFQTINNELNRFDDPEHHGIVKLHDKNAPNGNNKFNGYTIKATFEKVQANDQTVQFVDQNGANIDGENQKEQRSGIVDTSKITTTLNLAAWIKNLIDNKTVVNTTVPGKIDSLNPPVLNGNANTNLFASHNFSDVERWLKAANVNLWWSETESGNQNWLATDAIKSYDATKAKLWFALTNESTNLVLNLGNGLKTLNPNDNNQDKPITINLDAPKLINVKPTDAQVMIDKFSGNTKYLDVKVAEITTEIQKILQKQGSEFTGAPLTLLVQVGLEGFVDYKDLANTLKAKTTDVASGLVTVKFAIDPQHPDAANFGLVDGGDDELTLINDQRIKIFINDEGIFDKLKTAQLIGPDNTNFSIQWPDGWTVDPTSGLLNALNKQGLRLEFSFKDLDQNSNVTGTDPNQQWVRQVPSQYQLNQKKLYVRIQTTAVNFVYERIASHDAGTPIQPPNQSYKFALDLNLPQLIQLESAWLNQQLVPTNVDLTALNVNHFDAYERLVKNNINQPAEIQDKVAINYSFNGEDNLDKNALIAAILKYQQAFNAENQNFGLLQLWNNNSGQQIKAKFVKANANDNSYKLDIKGPNEQILDSSKIITTIDLQPVLAWLKTIKVDVVPDPARPNGIKSLTFPQISAPGDDHFNDKTWEQFKRVLANLNLQLQFRVLTNSNIGNNNDWVNTQEELKSYDPAIGKIQIRFQFDSNKASNLKARLDTTIIEGTQNQPSNAFDVQLNIKLIFQINRDHINAFFNDPTSIRGNTKNLVINEATEQKLIDAIKADNIAKNPEFAKANLYVGYQLGEGVIGDVWEKRTDFMSKLSDSEIDQQTNKVVFRLLIESNQENQFGTPEEINVLHAFEPPRTGIKIPYYINDGNWETNADKLILKGTSSNLRWDFDAAFGANVVTERNNRVYLRNNAGEALQMFFTTNPNATYDNPPGFGTNINELNSKWVAEKPQNLNAATKNLKVKLVPLNTGFVYGPASKNQARAHDVDIQIQREIIVDNAWLSADPLSNNQIELSNFTQQLNLLENWENQIYQKIVAANAIDLATAKNIKIEYTFANQTNRLSAAELLNQIEQARTNFNKPKLGIIQLWNKVRGDQIKAIFVSAKPDEFVLKTATSNNPTEDELSGIVDTSNIYTTISLVNYINHIKNNKTTVTLKENGADGEIDDFNLPQLPGQPGATFLSGYSFEEIIARLNQVGIQAKFAQTASTNANDWKPKEQIKNYDIQTSALFLAFEIEANATNTRLQWNATESIGPGQNMQGPDKAIKLPLDVPKFIIIDQTKPHWNNLAANFDFNGDTKNLKFNEANIQNFVNKILEDNAINSGDNSYRNAPLEIHFQVGELAFTRIDQLKDHLLKQTVDLPNRQISFKFVIPADQTNNWKLQAPDTEYQVFGNADPLIERIKIFINDNGNYQKLTQMVLEGTQDNLEWPWPWGKNTGIDEATGVLNPPLGGFGKGLKLLFSFNPNANNEGTDVETDWVSQVPKSFKPQYNEIWLQVQLTDAKLYTYEHANQKFNLSLAHIERAIKLNTDWLNLKLNNNQDLDLKDLLEQILSDYENAVKQRAQADANNPVADNLLDKFKIEYQFNNENTWVNKTDLLTKIKNYQNNTNQASFGILQLWNNQSGIKIKSKFSDADTTDNYRIELVDPTKPDHLLDTSNIITTIDFSAILDWLKTLEVPIEEGQNYQINVLKIPPINVAGSPFNNQTWTVVENTLATFGIIIQYSNNIKTEQPNWGVMTNVNRYDPTNPSFKIRFTTDGQKSQNIKFKWAANEILIGKTATESAPTILKIKAKLLVLVDAALINKFKTSAIFGGDTKNLDVTKVTPAATTFINEIITENEKNDPRYAQLRDQLEIQYVLQQVNPNAQTQWKSLQQLVNDLAITNSDQTTNQIWYRILLKNETDFQLSNQNKQPEILSNHQAPIDPNIKIKYYINAGEWETKAAQIAVSGTTDALEWNFADLFASNFVEQNNQVYLRNTAGQALQVLFTLNPNANYETPAGSSNNIADIETQWVTIKPTKIRPGEKNLKIKLIATTGFIYGPAEANPISAKAHNVKINVKNVIFVNKDWFNRSLVLNQTEISTLQTNNFDTWEQQIYEQIKQANGINDETIAHKVKIRYIFKQQKFTSAQDLLDEILSLRTNYQDEQSFGIVQLWNTISNRGTKIEAIFELDPADEADYLLKVVNQSGPATSADLQGLVDTDNVFTSISLIKYINILKTQKTTVDPKTDGKPGEINSFDPPGMPGQVGAEFLSGRSFAQIIKRLNEVGIRVKFAKTASTVANDWLDKNQVTAYDIQTSVLFLSFEIDNNAQNTKIQWDSNQTLNPGENLRGQKAIKLPLDVPKYIIINQTAPFWSTIKSDFNFNGNTKFINFNQNAIDEFIKNILNQNFIASNDPEYHNAPLKIEFQVGETAFVEIKDLKKYLEDQPDDLPNRTINFKFSIPKEAENQWRLERPNDTYTLLTESPQDQPEISKLKIYINDKSIFADLGQTKLKGTSQNLEWEFINNIQVNETTGILNAQNRGHGLKVEFTFNPNVAADEALGTDVNTQWVATMPKSFEVNQTKVFLRLALVDENLYEYEHKNKKIELSLADIIVILNLNSDWLKLINLTGTTKSLNINENNAKTELIQALPVDQTDLVQFEYSIDEQQWQNEAQFKQFLITQNGKKDAAHFILKREDIKVRFALNQIQRAKFQMSVDGILINPDNSNNPNKQLVDDQQQPPLNPDLQGVIELSHLEHFLAKNFAIEGTNNNLKFKITNRTQMDNLLQIYATDQLFDIKMTGVSNNGNFDWTKAVSILKQGRFIGENDLASLNFELDGNKKVALRFESLNSKYDVYYETAKQPQGYVLDISQNVRVTFEIENPFTKQQKTLALWWTADNDKTTAKYFQGEGGFKVVNGNANNIPDTANFVASADWLQSNQSGLSDKEKEVLELVYHIYEGEPTETEMNRVGSKEEINNYDGSTWKPLAQDLETVNGNNLTNFTKNLKLKVGQYVSVALRVKKEYAVGDDIYTLKDDDHSFIRPITTQAKPGRAHGYKIKTDTLTIDENTITLENMLNSEQPPLDGYTNLKRLNLVKDADDNYQGVELELQLFHEFHKGKNPQEVLITPFDKIKLIKRQPGNQSPTDYFKDANGDQIKDDQDAPIPILVDENGKPTAPIEANSATFKYKFTNYNDGFFGLTPPSNGLAKDQWGLFKNQKMEIVFSARQGTGGAAEPDYILDKDKSVDLNDQISPKIKFPIFNQDNIKYSFNHEEFAKDKVQYENATKPDDGPIDGRSKIKTLIKLNKTTSTSSTATVIEGDNAADAVAKLKAELQTSFKGKLGFETTYEKKTGGVDIRNDLELYNLTTLSNNDRIRIRIVSTDNDFIWAEPPKPLTINVSGLTALAPQRNKLKFLRVEQSGTINGKGAFKVLINDPKDSNSDPKEILEGWKFVLRVWNSEKIIKTGWTDDQNQIANLENSDKVEWKLLDEFGNPVSDPYYNTVAGEHKLNPDGSTEFVFNEMQYSNGKNSGVVVREGIGKYPVDSEIYPEDSGFVISGLQDALEIFEISDTAFAKVMAQLEPHYVGLNGQGTINFKEDYLSKNYYVNSLGELYEKPFDQPTFKQQVDDSVVEISLADFLANTTFYTSDPNLINYQNGFKFLGNDTNLNNHLSNGDQVWAQFDLRTDNNEVNRGISTELNPVTGLQELLTDPMTPLWYILMAIGGVVTLGGLSLLFLWIKRNRKLKR